MGNPANSVPYCTIQSTYMFKRISSHTCAESGDPFYLRDKEENEERKSKAETDTGSTPLPEKDKG